MGAPQLELSPRWKWAGPPPTPSSPLIFSVPGEICHLLQGRKSDTACVAGIGAGAGFHRIGKGTQLLFVWASYVAVLRILLMAGLGGAGLKPESLMRKASVLAIILSLLPLRLAVSWNHNGLSLGVAFSGFYSNSGPAWAPPSVDQSLGLETSA